jgi:hypothetical protein
VPPLRIEAAGNTDLLSADFPAGLQQWQDRLHQPGDGNKEPAESVGARTSNSWRPLRTTTEDGVLTERQRWVMRSDQRQLPDDDRGDAGRRLPAEEAGAAHLRPAPPRCWSSLAVTGQRSRTGPAARRCPAARSVPPRIIGWRPQPSAMRVDYLHSWATDLLVGPGAMLRERMPPSRRKCSRRPAEGRWPEAMVGRSPGRCRWSTRPPIAAPATSRYDRRGEAPARAAGPRHPRPQPPGRRAVRGNQLRGDSRQPS